MINVIYAEKINKIGEDNHKVIMTDFNALFVPRKGDLINFKGFMPPNNILVYVYSE
jgi:hypothetical protein